jgi:putative Ca2+/H+ antiporter (TMEM165/GDT1 family)
VGLTAYFLATEVELVPQAYVSVSPDFTALVVAYTTVLLAELVGDKSVYTVAALGLRFRPSPVLIGITLAFMGKMLAAVLFGKVILHALGHWTDVLSALGFFACALFIWFKEPQVALRNEVRERGWLHAAAISFSSLFFTEWGDTGQIAAAALAAHTHALVWVWFGGTLALLTKGSLAMTVGVRLSMVVPERFIRTIASASYCLLGILSLSQLLVS